MVFDTASLIDIKYLAIYISNLHTLALISNAAEAMV